ncbi:MAG TPA: post-COAP-1 domain-containing protein [Candidatus Limnocylindrales bacterium]|nr:post-COAP-1 domain-containing protein [Candidatus Limnocylindrales bacterium]
MRSKQTRLRVAAVPAAALLWLAGAIPVAAADTLTPTPVNLTLKAGESTVVNKTLALDGLPARADIIVAIDTTSSMSTPIAQAQADANNLCSTVQASIPGARFAAVDFEDYAAMPFGSAGDVPYTLLTPGFISSCTTFAAAIATMSADGGGDPPEAYNRVFYEAYSDAAYSAPVASGGRDPLASQFLVVLGDAMPHDSAGFGSCPASPPDDFGRDGAAGGGDDLTTAGTLGGLVANGITLLMVRYATGVAALSCYTDMATAANGTAVDSPTVGSIGPFIVNNAKLVPYTVDLAVSAACPIGLSFNPTFPLGPFTGAQSIPFDETVTAPTAVGTYTCTITATTDPGGPTAAVETVVVTVTPGDPASLDLQPASATNTVDDQHCVTATVVDAFGNPTPGITVIFSVDPTTARTPSSGSAVTDALGQATFCYTSALPGGDVITAFADTDGSTVQDGTEPGATATKTWVLPTSSEGCKVTYGGRIETTDGDKATFGGNAKGSGPSGQENFRVHGPTADFHLHSIDVQAVLCSEDGLSASIFGTATIDGAGSVDYRIDVTDAGEPGTSDTYEIRLSDGYDSGLQTLAGGNVQVHEAGAGAAAAAKTATPSPNGHRWQSAPTATSTSTATASSTSSGSSHKPAESGKGDKPKKHTK